MEFWTNYWTNGGRMPACLFGQPLANRRNFPRRPRHFFGVVNLIPQRPFALQGPNLPCFEQHLGIFLLAARPRAPFDPTVALPISPSLPPSTTAPGDSPMSFPGVMFGRSGWKSIPAECREFLCANRQELGRVSGTPAWAHIANRLVTRRTRRTQNFT